jgi:hypothetical protein
MRAGTPPRGTPMREPPPLDAVQRRAHAMVTADEANPLQLKRARSSQSDHMTRAQVKQMLYAQGFELDEAYLDGVIGTFDTDGSGTIDSREFKNLYRILLQSDDAGVEDGPSNVEGGLTRDEALHMIQSMDLDVTEDYIDGAWDAHDKNGDGLLDDEEFGSLLSVLRKHHGPAHSKGGASDGDGDGGCSLRWAVLGLLAAAFVLFAISSVYEAFEADPEPVIVSSNAPAPRRQPAPAVRNGEMSLSGLASVDDIEAGLVSATGGTVTIISYNQEVSAEATLPITVDEFDQAAETQFVAGLSTTREYPRSFPLYVVAVRDIQLMSLFCLTATDDSQRRPIRYRGCGSGGGGQQWSAAPPPAGRRRNDDLLHDPRRTRR